MFIQIMNSSIIYFISVLCIIGYCVAPPVTQNKQDEKNDDVTGLEDYMEYHRYLKEVVNALESDPDFRKKLETAHEDEIKSGKIAEQLEFVSHHVRTRLDEIKRLELDRLKELTERKRQLLNNNVIDEDPTHNHLDHANPHTFEIEDLKKLIAKTTEDLAEADKKRREEFKQYELQKEFEKQDKLNHTNGSEREKLEKEIKSMEEKHKKHEKLHEPGHKAQLEEVWEEQDQMQQDFDPKAFFMLHDLDGNGLWDQDEVKALFVKELDKMYQQGAPEDDMRERIEEMERMRESVFKEIDHNHDGFIDYNEFLAQTKSNEFKQDHGWQGLDEQKPYTDEELAEYIRQHQANQIPQHYPPPPPGYHVPPGGYHPNAVPPPPNMQYQQGQVPHNVHPNDINSNGYGNYPPNYQHQGYPQQGYQQYPNNNQQHGGNYQPAPNFQQPNVPPPQVHNYPQQPNIPQQQNNIPQQQNVPQQPKVPQQQQHIPQQQNIPPQQQQQQNIPPQQQQNIPPQQQQNIPPQQQQNIPPQQQNIPQQPKEQNVKHQDQNAQPPNLNNANQ